MLPQSISRAFMQIQPSEAALGLPATAGFGAEADASQFGSDRRALPCVLVIGAASYLGSHFLLELTRPAMHERFRLVAMDTFQYDSHPDTIRYVEQLNGTPITFIEGSLWHPEALKPAFQQHRPDVVVVIGHNTGLRAPDRNPGQFFRRLTHGALALVHLLTEFECTRLVFTSTAHVYGQSAGLGPVSEQTQPRPQSAYGDALLGMERIFTWGTLRSRMRFVALRMFDLAGSEPTGHLGEDSFPSESIVQGSLNVLTKLAKNVQVQVTGTPGSPDSRDIVRDFVHVQDAAFAILRALDLVMGTRPVPKVLNIGSGCGLSVVEVVEQLNLTLRCNLPIMRVPVSDEIPVCLIADIASARKHLSWVPRQSTLCSMLLSALHFRRRFPVGYLVSQRVPKSMTLHSVGLDEADLVSAGLRLDVSKKRTELAGQAGQPDGTSTMNAKLHGPATKESVYHDIVDLLMDRNRVFLEAFILKAKQEDSEKLALSLLRIFQCYGFRAQDVIQTAVRSHIICLPQVELLFRNNTLVNKLLMHYIKMVGGPYLRHTFHDLLLKFYSSVQVMEMDARRLEEYNKPLKRRQRLTLQQTEQNLKDGVLAVLGVIFKSVDDVAGSLRIMCYTIRVFVDDQWPDSGAGIKSVGSFIGLRYICPAILRPQLHKIFSASEVVDVPKIMERSILLIAKCIQALVAERPLKEPFMQPINSFLRTQRSRVEAFLYQVSQVPPEGTLSGKNPHSLGIPPSIREEAVRHVFTTLKSVNHELMADLSDHPIIMRRYAAVILTHDAQQRDRRKKPK